MKWPAVVQVQSIRRLNEYVNEYELAPAEPVSLPEFNAGAHIDLYVPGIGKRQYSLVRPWTKEGSFVIAVQREQSGRGGSNWIHDHLELGSIIEVGTPRNNFPLTYKQGERTPRILIAGGIGITPILSMSAELDRKGEPHQMLILVRDPSREIYSEELRGKYLDGSARLVHTDLADALFDFDRYLGGFDEGAQIYCCGPGSLMKAVEAAAARRNMPLRTEAFGAETPADQERGHAEFRIQCAQTDTSFVVPAGKSILDCLLEAGVDVDHSCKEGYCGSCITRFLDGTPIHSDTCLGPEDRLRYVAVCTAHAPAGSELILDL